MPELQPFSLNIQYDDEKRQEFYAQLQRELNYTFKDIYAKLDEAFGLLNYSFAPDDIDLSDAEVTLADASVTTSKLKTSYGQLSGTTQGTITGGQYCFLPQFKRVGGTSITAYRASAHVNTSYATTVAMAQVGGATPWCLTRYVTSSGEVFWVYYLKRLDTGKIIKMSAAPDHPCFGNGNNPYQLTQPFPDYDPKTGLYTMYDYRDGSVKEQFPAKILVVNPPKLAIAKLELDAIKEGKGRDRGQILFEDYEPDETKALNWPKERVTVGLTNDWSDKWINGEPTETIKEKIPQPDYLKAYGLKRKKPKEVKSNETKRIR